MNGAHSHRRQLKQVTQDLPNQHDKCSPVFLCTDLSVLPGNPLISRPPRQRDKCALVNFVDALSRWGPTSKGCSAVGGAGVGGGGIYTNMTLQLFTPQTLCGAITTHVQTYTATSRTPHSSKWNWTLTGAGQRLQELDSSYADETRFSENNNNISFIQQPETHTHTLSLSQESELQRKSTTFPAVRSDGLNSGPMVEWSAVFFILWRY